MPWLQGPEQASSILSPLHPAAITSPWPSLLSGKQYGTARMGESVRTLESAEMGCLVAQDCSDSVAIELLVSWFWCPTVLQPISVWVRKPSVSC